MKPMLSWNDLSERVDVWRIELESSRAKSRSAEIWVPRVLARYLNLPKQVTVSRDEHGRPFVPELPDLDFNLSHSGSTLLLAITRGRRVGIDVENRRSGLSFDRISEVYFAAAEREFLEGLPEDEKVTEFFRIWTAKEAVLKATGIGLQGLSEMESTVGPDWSVIRLEEGPATFATVAVHAPESSFSIWEMRL